MKRLLPQRCPIVLLYLTWILYLGGIVVLVVRAEYVPALAWTLLVPASVWAYVRFFPKMSSLLGYGRVDDARPDDVGRGALSVTVYSSLGCPFCPIVERRLEALQGEMGFELQRVDLTLRPDVAKAKGIRSVPVVEVGDRWVVGHATTRELAELVRKAAPARAE
jgi:glutaredoxin